MKKNKDYKNMIIEIGLPEGFALIVDPEDRFSGYKEAPEILGWIDSNNDGARLGIIPLEKYPIRMFVKVVGFSDHNAPVRNWGQGFEAYARRKHDTRKKTKSTSHRSSKKI